MSDATGLSRGAWRCPLPRTVLQRLVYKFGMPPACPVDLHDGCYSGQRLLYKFGMPLACPVVPHDGRYPGPSCRD